MTTQPDIQVGELVTVREYCERYLRPPLDGKDPNVRRAQINRLRLAEDELNRRVDDDQQPIRLLWGGEGRGRPYMVSIEAIRNACPQMVDTHRRVRRIADQAMVEMREDQQDNRIAMARLHSEVKELRERLDAMARGFRKLSSEVYALKKAR